jgi:hypothetical protein
LNQFILVRLKAAKHLAFLRFCGGFATAGLLSLWPGRSKIWGALGLKIFFYGIILFVRGLLSKRACFCSPGKEVAILGVQAAIPCLSYNIGQ